MGGFCECRILPFVKYFLIVLQSIEHPSKLHFSSKIFIFIRTPKEKKPFWKESRVIQYRVRAEENVSITEGLVQIRAASEIILKIKPIQQKNTEKL